MNSHFYIPQAPPFCHVIHSIWQTQRSSIPGEVIIPKGVVEIIFNLSDDSPISAWLGNNQYEVPDCFINGFNSVPILLRPPAKQFLFGVQFKPFAVRKIFGAPAGEFSDTLVNLSLIDPTFHSVWHQLSTQINFNDRVSVFLSWIKKRLNDCEPREKLINDFLDDIHQHDVSVTELASSLCYSPRQLSRKLIEVTRMNTEEMLLYKKYLHAVHLIHHTSLSLTEIGYQSHFCDQAHFIKSFKTYAHMTPGEYRRNKSLVKGHIFQDVR